jgi:hypothetical protein
MLYRPRFPTVEASPLAESGDMLVELDPPLWLKVEATTFEALFEPEGARRRSTAATRNHKQTTQPHQTIWDLLQEALSQKGQTYDELFNYVTSKGKVTTKITVGSILQAKRRAGLVDCPDERGGAWQLTK